jgi:hypothetical protein
MDSCRVALTARLVGFHDIVYTDTTASYFQIGSDAAPDPESRVPRDTRITGAYPNPFNPDTRIAFSVAKPGVVTLAIYNLMGQKVRTLETGTISAGEHWVTWDGMTEGHAQAGTGLYLCRLETSGSVDTRRILLMR